MTKHIPLQKEALAENDLYIHKLDSSECDVLTDEKTSFYLEQIEEAREEFIKSVMNSPNLLERLASLYEVPGVNSLKTTGIAQRVSNHACSPAVKDYRNNFANYARRIATGFANNFDKKEFITLYKDLFLRREEKKKLIKWAIKNNINRKITDEMKQSYDRICLFQEPLICSHMRFAFKESLRVASGYKFHFVTKHDVVSAGFNALIGVVDKFDKKRSNKIITASSFDIRLKVQQAIFRNNNTISVSEKVQRELKNGNGINMISIDSHYKDNSVLDFIPDNKNVSPLESVCKTEMKNTFSEISDELTGRDKYIFDNRLYTNDPVTLKKIANIFGVTKEAIRQNECRLKERLRQDSRLLSFYK